MANKKQVYDQLGVDLHKVKLRKLARLFDKQRSPRRMRDKYDDFYTLKKEYR